MRLLTVVLLLTLTGCQHKPHGNPPPEWSSIAEVSEVQRIFFLIDTEPGKYLDLTPGDYPDDWFAGHEERLSFIQESYRLYYEKEGK